ncbi:MAG: hypothetical protein LBP51_02705 [Deferribacteraceae bacterium]|nr:hypothetical protein [Deferribacteraceae bacterium]
MKNNNFTDIEVVEYGKLPHNSPTFIKSVEEDEFVLRLALFTSSLEKSLLFWQNFGAKLNSSDCTIKLPLDKKPTTFSFEERPTLENSYFGGGFCSLAFCCIDAQRCHKRLKELSKQAGWRLTDCAALYLAHKKITLFFVMGEQNELLEVYSVCKYEDNAS